MDAAARRARTPHAGASAAVTPTKPDDASTAASATAASETAPSMPAEPLAPPSVPTTFRDPRGQVLARAAQELKAPLAIIKGSATTLLADPDRWDPATRHEMLRLIDGQADHLHDLVNHLLAIWRLDPTHLPVQVEPVSPETVIGELAERAQASAPHHRFTLAVSGDLRPLNCDAERIARALDRLVAYLLSAAPARSTIEIEARPAAGDAPGATVLMRRGGATPTPAALATLFEPFGPPNPTAASGLADHPAPDPRFGLAEARAVILAHGGRIIAAPPEITPGLEIAVTLPASAPEHHSVASALPAHLTFARAARDKPAILIASEDPHMARYLRANLGAAGFHPVLAAGPGQIPRLLDLETPDLVLLDAGSAEYVPAGTSQVLRDCDGLPVIILGAGDADCVAALDGGAADYLARPVAMPELLARVRAALRRAARLHTEAASADETFRTGELTIDYGRREVRMGERVVALSRTEYKLLRALARQAGRVLPHDLLLERVWGPGYGAEVEFLWVYVRRLRRKIEPDPRHPRYLLTVPGVGYRLAQVAP